MKHFIQFAVLKDIRAHILKNKKSILDGGQLDTGIVGLCALLNVARISVSLVF